MTTKLDPHWADEMAGFTPPDLTTAETAFIQDQLVGKVGLDLMLAGVPAEQVGAAAQRVVNRILYELVAVDRAGFSPTWYHLVARWDAATAPDAPGNPEELTARAVADLMSRGRRQFGRLMDQVEPPVCGVERAEGQWWVNLCDAGFRTVALYRIDRDQLTQLTDDQQWPERFQDMFA